MTSLQKVRKLHLFKCVSLLCAENGFIPSKPRLYANGSPHILQLRRFCRIERAVKNGGNLCEPTKKSRFVRQEAQAALLEYLHSTRSLQFLDAENMSKNAPEFFDKLLKRVDIDDGDVGRSLARFLRYHPINEFEPFFESIGLDPSEYSSFLPRNLMFLNDDQLLLQNYYVLCNYGVPRNRIGKIYKEAREVFIYDYGVLQSKLRSFENLGLKQSLVVKIIASSPYLLKGDLDLDFIVFLEKLKNVGIEYSLLEEHISEEDLYNWKCMLKLMCLLGDWGLTEKKLGEVIKHHPDLLLEKSGQIAICLLGFLLKFGLMQNDVLSVFLEFPDISVVKFSNNLCQCYKFLVEIKMPVQDIGRMFVSYPTLLGSCELKKVKSLLATLNCGLNRLCQMIKDDPYVLKQWVLGVRVGRLQEPNRILRVRMMKTKFLISLGFVEKSREMERALKVFRGKGVELQERFDCLVSTGLSREDVIEMLKVSPQILNQSKEVIQTKIDFFVRELGYPVSALVTHPALVSYTIQRVKLRLLMYKWLKDEGAVRPDLALSTLMSCSEEIFMKNYVNSHPRGPEFWERLKKKVYAD
ncbi:hypothetical protein CDL12_07334 [Handroanthus impetiginosus]|uniref:Mitochondrial transcription termination factor, mTERF n=1 Tax=Handroanthus impetiginosus TaxID=429701 RepID=A0A2G9HR62_9LAMI|nr:hypothetical protein CDL12_07334 [Handroanthus impetiginosus]